MNPSFQILDLAVLPSGTCFAATDAGLLRRADRGTIWEPAVPELAAAGIAATAVTVAPPSGPDATLLVAIPGGIGTSPDSGVTWRFNQLPLPAPIVSSMVCSPRFETDGVVFLGTVQDGVFRSGDGGTTWVQWNSGLLDTSVLAIAISPHFQTDDTLFAGTTTGVYRSTNGGRRWTPVDFQPNAVVSISGLGTLGTDDGLVVVAGTEAGDLWTSTNAGNAWQPVAAAGVGKTVRGLTVTAAGIAVLGDDAVMFSPDGEQWQVLEHLPVPAADIAVLAGDAPPPGLLAVTTAGVVVSIDLP